MIQKHSCVARNIIVCRCAIHLTKCYFFFSTVNRWNEKRWMTKKKLLISFYEFITYARARNIFFYVAMLCLSHFSYMVFFLCKTDFFMNITPKHISRELKCEYKHRQSTDDVQCTLYMYSWLRFFLRVYLRLSLFLSYSFFYFLVSLFHSRFRHTSLE